MESVGSDVPVYIGHVSLDLINATRIFLGKEIIASHFILINPWQPFTIEDTFKVYPYLMDHSSPEAFAFMIEVDGKRVFYSGDIRSTG
jgi:ribonuclease J